MKILLADDHALIRSGLRSELAQLGDATEFVEAWDAETLRRAFDSCRDLDLALVDLGMPGMEGAQTIAALREDHPTIPLIVVSGSDSNDDMRAVLRAGAAGFIPKATLTRMMLPAIQLVLAGGRYVPPQLLHALEDDRSELVPVGPVGEPRAAAIPSRESGCVPIAASRNLLSARQQQVLGLLGRGYSNKVIARELAISEATVKSHVATIFDLMQVHNRVSAVAEARKLSGPVDTDRAK